MKNEDIELLKKTAILLEKTHIKVSRDLMEIAKEERPHGPFINKKLYEYEKYIESEKKIHKMIASGELAIIPAGFRCHTKLELFKRLNFSQPSMPFDSGFFPPSSIASVLKKGKIDLRNTHDKINHTVCTKDEEHFEKGIGKGIRFESVNYSYIDEQVKRKPQRNINKYLDSTFGYYTLDIENKFVLAHYNWHELSHKNNLSNQENIENINSMLNKRIERMFETCDKSKHIVFIVGGHKRYDHMMIDNETFTLNDFNELNYTASEVFGKDKCTVKSLMDVSSAKKLLEALGI